MLLDPETKVDLIFQGVAAVLVTAAVGSFTYCSTEEQRPPKNLNSLSSALDYLCKSQLTEQAGKRNLSIPANGEGLTMAVSKDNSTCKWIFNNADKGMVTTLEYPVVPAVAPIPAVK